MVVPWCAIDDIQIIFFDGYSFRSEALDTKICDDLRYDYMECLHHKKEVRVIGTDNPCRLQPLSHFFTVNADNGDQGTEGWTNRKVFKFWTKLDAVSALIEAHLLWVNELGLVPPRGQHTTSIVEDGSGRRKTAIEHPNKTLFCTEREGIAISSTRRRRMIEKGEKKLRFNGR